MDCVLIDYSLYPYRSVLRPDWLAVFPVDKELCTLWQMTVFFVCVLINRQLFHPLIHP